MPDHPTSSSSSSSRLIATPRTATLRSNAKPLMRLILEQPALGTAIVREVTGGNPPSTVEVRFEPLSSNEILRGQPAQWCNLPTAGQPLIFNVPTPKKAGDPPTVATLTVSQQVAGGSSPFGVTIKHV